LKSPENLKKLKSPSPRKLSIKRNNSRQELKSNQPSFSQIRIKNRYWSQFCSPVIGSMWIQGEVTRIWRKIKKVELLYADKDYVDQPDSELFHSPPEKANFIMRIDN